MILVLVVLLHFKLGGKTIEMFELGPVNSWSRCLVSKIVFLRNVDEIQTIGRYYSGGNFDWKYWQILQLLLGHLVDLVPRNGAKQLRKHYLENILKRL